MAYEALKRRLTRYGIEQIGIFADACRTPPSDIETADLTPDAVLGLGPRQKNDPALDKFVAAQGGTATFAIPGASEQDDRCLFSGVLLEGLWGTKPAAFSKIGTFLDDSALVIPGLVELATHLMPARFTTLDREGAQQPASLLHLERRAR